GVAVLRQVSDATVGPTEEISRQIRQTIIASKEAGTLQISDEQVNAYVDFLRLTLEAAFQAKHRAGIERYWPVARIAIKTVDQLGYDAVSAFRKVIVGQSGAKELDLVSPNDMWRGMKIDVQVHMDSVSAAYKLWARKIEILLRSQDAWKIKAGLDRGEYSVGIEGQKVRIDPSMVSFIESIPEYVVEEPFEGGVVFLDTRMSKELIAEGWAKEIVNIVREARKDMRLADDRIVEIELVADKPFRAMLQPWKDMILGIRTPSRCSSSCSRTRNRTSSRQAWDKRPSSSGCGPRRCRDRSARWNGRAAKTRGTSGGTSGSGFPTVAPGARF